MQIQADMKMAEIIHLNYHLLPIISRFGINLGFGDKSVKQICKEHSIDVNFFLEIVNSFHLKNYFPKKNLQGFPLKLIIDYLRKSHDHYLFTKIPRIAALLGQLSQYTPPSVTGTLRLIDTFFNGYRNELTNHIQREEDKVYPYVFAVEQAFNSKRPSDEIVGKIRVYSIEDFKMEHDNIEDKLFDLKNLLIKYLPEPVDADLSHSILVELFRLESDISDHTRMENKVLVPKVSYMEKWILEHFKP
jgi:regulator of cell morphogenesis and NO signaling